MTDPDSNAMVTVLRTISGDLTLAWSSTEEIDGTKNVRISEYEVLDMVDRLTKIAAELETMQPHEAAKAEKPEAQRPADGEQVP